MEGLLDGACWNVETMGWYWVYFLRNVCVWVWMALSAEKGKAAARQLELQAYLHKNKEVRADWRDQGRNPSTYEMIHAETYYKYFVKMCFWVASLWDFLSETTQLFDFGNFWSINIKCSIFCLPSIFDHARTFEVQQ